MRRSSLFLILFIVYCVEIGVLLILWPWSASWERIWIQLPWSSAQQVVLDPLFRSVVSAFGGLHLVWGAHDLDLWLVRRRQARTAER